MIKTRTAYQQRIGAASNEALIGMLAGLVAGNGFGFNDADVADLRAEILTRMKGYCGRGGHDWQLTRLNRHGRIDTCSRCRATRFQTAGNIRYEETQVGGVDDEQAREQCHRERFGGGA